jgi:hypothetical protein
VHAFFMSVRQAVQWSASRCDHCNPVERAPGTHDMGNLMGLRSRKDNLVKGNSFDPDWYRKATPRSSSP